MAHITCNTHKRTQLDTRLPNPWSKDHNSPWCQCCGQLQCKCYRERTCIGCGKQGDGSIIGIDGSCGQCLSGSY